MRVYLDKLKELAEKKQTPLRILELGCIRNVAPEWLLGDGGSTYYIAKFVQERDWDNNFYSCDVDTSICSNYIESLGLDEYVLFIQEDVLKFLTAQSELIEIGNIYMRKYDFIYLDTENDPEQIYQAFLLCEKLITKGGYIVVDDTVEGSEIILKGNKLLPYLRQNNYNFEVIGIQTVIYF
jgi:predicted O-methyltransferase YrrM